MVAEAPRAPCTNRTYGGAGRVVPYSVGPAIWPSAPRPNGRPPRLTLRVLALATLAAAAVAVGVSPAASATREMIGRSVEGRPIVATRLGPERAKRTVLVVGCIHGDECAGIPILDRLARRPLTGVISWVIRTLNPDGRAAGTRGNARGVDLNRNFPAGWRRIPRLSPYYSGARPGSEPETEAALTFLRRVRPDLSVWFHQPETNVRDPQRSQAAVSYARRVGLPFLPLPAPPGAATRWQRLNNPQADAFVVELPAGPLPSRSAARHVAAIRAVVRTAMPSPPPG